MPILMKRAPALRARNRVELTFSLSLGLGMVRPRADRALPGESPPLSATTADHLSMVPAWCVGISPGVVERYHGVSFRRA